MLQSMNRKSIWLNAVILFCWLPVLFYSVGQYSMVSLSIYLTFLFLSVLFCFIVLEKKEIQCNIGIIYIILLGIILISFGFYYSLWDSWKFRNILFLIVIFFILAMLNKLYINKFTMKLIYLIPVILAFIFTFIAFFRNSYDLKIYGNSLYLHFQNPNILANILLIMLIYQCLGRIESKKNTKIIYTLAIILTIILLYLTKARSAFYSAIIFILIYLIKRRRFQVKKYLAIIIINIPLLIVVFSAFINTFLQNTFLNFLGKAGLSGREEIWNEIIKIITHEIDILFFGVTNIEVYKQFSIEISNCHNSYLQIIWNYGIVVFLLFYIFLWKNIRECASKVSDRYTFTALLGFAFLLLNNSFETNLVDGIIGMTFVSLLLFSLIKVHNRAGG